MNLDSRHLKLKSTNEYSTSNEQNAKNNTFHKWRSPARASIALHVLPGREGPCGLDMVWGLATLVTYCLPTYFPIFFDEFHNPWTGSQFFDLDVLYEKEQNSQRNANARSPNSFCQLNPVLRMQLLKLL